VRGLGLGFRVRVKVKVKVKVRVHHIVLNRAQQNVWIGLECSGGGA
jgi:hypothetical protein